MPASWLILASKADTSTSPRGCWAPTPPWSLAGKVWSASSFPCGSGRLAEASWLLPRAGVKKAVVFRRYPDSIVGPGCCLDCCAGGYLETARWLARVFALTKREAAQHGNAALAGSCRNGHLDAARWLVGTFSLERSDALEALGCTPCLFSPSVCSWLSETFGLEHADLRTNALASFCVACFLGKEDSVKWLHEEFGLTRVEVMSGSRRAFEWACAGGRLRVALWLHETFSVTPEEAEAGVQLVRPARAPELVAWLQEAFHLRGTGPAFCDKDKEQELRVKKARAPRLASICKVTGGGLGVWRDPAAYARHWAMGWTPREKSCGRR